MLECTDNGGRGKPPDTTVLMGQVRPWRDSEAKSSVWGGPSCTDFQEQP